MGERYPVTFCNSKTRAKTAVSGPGSENAKLAGAAELAWGRLLPDGERDGAVGFQTPQAVFKHRRPFSNTSGRFQTPQAVFKQLL
jgi:hypothetical protein